MDIFNKKLWERFKKDLNLDTFREKKQLHPKFWQDLTLNEEIRIKLKEIATTFFKNLDLDVEIDDITFTGSLANYNWSKFSDIDLHILVNYAKVDENTDLVKEFFRAKSSIWNKNHKILISGHEIEVYVQDKNEEHHSTGVFSIENSEWIVQPQRQDVKINDELVSKKANSLMDQIDRAYDLYDEKKYSQSLDYAEKLSEKIKKFRKSGLESEGEYSVENVVFKILRRNEYMRVLSDLKTHSYDKIMSLNGDYTKKLKIYVSQAKNEVKTGFNRLFEIEKFQKRVKNKHQRLKKLNIGLGGQKNKPPYTKKANYKRSKSAPPGFGA